MEDIFPVRRLSQFLTSQERKNWIDNSVQFFIMGIRFIPQRDMYDNQNWHLQVMRDDDGTRHILSFRHTEGTKRAMQMEWLQKYLSNHDSFGQMVLCSMPSERKGFKDLQYLALVEVIDHEEVDE